jgi:hypothetical protein
VFVLRQGRQPENFTLGFLLFRAKALFSFKAEEERELGFQKGSYHWEETSCYGAKVPFRIGNKVPLGPAIKIYQGRKYQCKIPPRDNYHLKVGKPVVEYRKEKSTPGSNTT